MKLKDKFEQKTANLPTTEVSSVDLWKLGPREPIYFYQHRKKEMYQNISDVLDEKNPEASGEMSSEYKSGYLDRTDLDSDDDGSDVDDLTIFQQMSAKLDKKSLGASGKTLSVCKRGHLASDLDSEDDDELVPVKKLKPSEKE